MRPTISDNTLDRLAKRYSDFDDFCLFLSGVGVIFDAVKVAHSLGYKTLHDYWFSRKL
jgi:hypothetical protein